MATKGIKGLAPSLREKKRYVVFEVLSEKSISDRTAINKAIIGSFLQMHGEATLAKAGLLTLPDFDEKTQRVIMRTSTKTVNDLSTAAMLVKEINKQKVIIQTVGVSGVLKKVRACLAR